jgi:hypothetical protein
MVDYPNGAIAMRGGNGKLDEREMKVAVFEIENEETFHLKELYKYLHDYLIEEENFVSLWGDDKPEVFFLEKQSSTGSREHHIWWRYLYYPNNSEYLRYVIKIDFQSIAMGKKEVIKDGQKLKLDSGDLIIRVQSFLQLDYKNEWKDHFILKRFDRVFRHYVYKSQIDFYKLDLYKTTYKIQNKIKQFLQLATYGTVVPAWQPEKGMR